MEGKPAQHLYPELLAFATQRCCTGLARALDHTIVFVVDLRSFGMPGIGDCGRGWFYDEIETCCKIQASGDAHETLLLIVACFSELLFL